MESPRALPLLIFSPPLAPNVNVPSGAPAPPIGSAYKLLTHNFISVLKQVGNCPFAVISMSGNSRIGKSYTLNYFIRHLSGDQGNSSGSSGEFKWRKGTERETIGVNLWSQPFFTNDKGRRIAVLLMDAQGLFDPYTTIQQNSVIFALCSLFSSVGIFNLLKKLHADTLQNVNFFTQYARDIGHKRNSQGHLDDDSEGFQRLVIMVRDFDDDDEYGYGYHDNITAPLNSKGTCKNYFQDTMSIESNADIPYEYKAVIKGIRDNYNSIGIVLHPDPGQKFRQNPTENTPNEEYITKTKEFVALMLSDQYLITKKIDGDELTGTQFIPYVEHLGDICKNAVDTFPAAQTIAESASIMSFNLAFTNAYSIFLETANGFMAANPNVEDIYLQGAYEKAIQEALVAFNKIKKIGWKQKEVEVRNNLLAKCKSKFDTLKEAFCLRRDLHHVKKEFELQTEISNQTITELNLQKGMLEEQKKQSGEAIGRHKMVNTSGPRALPLLDYKAERSPFRAGFLSGYETTYKLLTGNLIQVLEKVGSCPFAAICMTGISRIGKSYTLNHFLGSLSSAGGKYSNSSKSQITVDYDLDPSKMFLWRKGTERETVGINLWSEPFFINQKGRRIAVLLMDAQGIFDPYTTLEQNCVIFTLATLLSSVSIFNCLQKIRMDTIQNLNFFTQYTKSVVEKLESENSHHGKNKTKVASDRFQKLLLLVRDYDDPEEFGFGYHDPSHAPHHWPPGECHNYFHEKLAPSQAKNVPYENRAFMKGIRDGYESVGIFLLPDPGVKFRQNPEDNKPRKEFMEYTQNFIERILSDKYLVAKKVDGKEVSGTDFIPYVQHLGEMCTRSKDYFPAVKTSAEASAVMSHVAAQAHAYNLFVEKLADFIKSGGNYEDARLETEYIHILKEILLHFTKFKKIGGKQMEDEYQEQLVEKCNLKFTKVKELCGIQRQLNAKSKEEMKSPNKSSSTSTILKLTKSLQAAQDLMRLALAERRIIGPLHL